MTVSSLRGSPFSSTPDDIIFTILEVVLEADSTPEEFRATLRSASLVCRAWRVPAQALLSRCLSFYGSRSMRKWLESKAPGRWSNQILVAKIVDPETLARGVRATRGLRVLRLEGCDNMAREILKFPNLDCRSCYSWSSVSLGE